MYEIMLKIIFPVVPLEGLISSWTISWALCPTVAIRIIAITIHMNVRDSSANYTPRRWQSPPTLRSSPFYPFRTHRGQSDSAIGVCQRWKPVNCWWHYAIAAKNWQSRRIWPDLCSISMEKINESTLPIFFLNTLLKFIRLNLKFIKLLIIHVYHFDFVHNFTSTIHFFEVVIVFFCLLIFTGGYF